MIVERFSAAHAVDTFSCGNEELDLWLRHAAVTANRAGTARVYVILGGTRMIGYFALLPHQVLRADIPPGIGRGAPDTIPSYLLARLAVAEDLHGAEIEDGVPSRTTESYLCMLRAPRRRPRASPYSVAFGWPIEQSVIHTTRRASSMQYQIRPALVTSNCHCSRSLPSRFGSRASP